MEKDVKLTLIFLIIVIVTLVLNYILPESWLVYIFEIIQFGLTIAGLIFSIRLVKQKKDKKARKFGIVALVIFSLNIFLFLISFMIGFFLGIFEALGMM